MNKSLPELIGVVSCGGASSRMGSDKSLLKYHVKPQRYFLYDLLKTFCDNVIISCNSEQVLSVQDGYNFQVDTEEFHNHGPVSGLLSIFKSFPECSILFIGCDYPYLNSDCIQELISKRNLSSSAVCYCNPENGIPEPLIAVYENICFEKILTRFYENKFSLKEFLEESNITYLNPMNKECLKSVDTKDEYYSSRILIDNIKMSTIKTTIDRLEDHELKTQEDILAIEEPLEIQISFDDKNQKQTKNLSVTMRTPGGDKELALGFLFTEGIIENIQQVESVDTLYHNSIRVILSKGVNFDLKKSERNFYTTSSCGVCGKSSIEAINTIKNKAIENNSLSIDESIIYRLPSILRKHQNVFDQTGGLHACAIFDAKGELVLMNEDVGRHNALDKLIGSALQKKMLPLDKFILLLSGRASFELIQKATMAGISFVASIGAPSSLAVELALNRNITLIGFLRSNSFNIYCGKNKLRFENHISLEKLL